MAQCARPSTAGVCSYRRRILAEPHRLQPDPHPEIGCRIGELRKDTRKSLLCRAKRLNPQHKAPHRNGKTSNFPVFPQTARGTDFTIECAKKYGKPYCIIHYLDRGAIIGLKNMISQLGRADSLNIAGPRESEHPGAYHLC